MIVEKKCYVVATMRSPIEFRTSEGTLSPYYEDAVLLTEQEAEEDVAQANSTLQMLPVTASLEV